MSPIRRNLLRFALLAVGLAFLAIYPIMMVFPGAWSWEPRQPEYEQMLVGIYAVLGVFLLRAIPRPEAHLSLIWFAVWSSVVHGGIMAVQALLDPAERANFYGDIPALFVAAVLLAVLTPMRLGREPPPEGGVAR